MSQPRRIRVLVAEDSTAMQAALVALLGEDPGLEIIGCAADGETAVAMARSLRPDVITMDIAMPRLDGVTATQQIMASAAARVLVVSAVDDRQQLELTFQAIAAGALEVIAKPTTSRPDVLRDWGRRVREAIRLMAEVPVITRRYARARTAGHSVDVIGIVASTGGPPALAQVLGALPGDLPIPLVVAQHIAAGFVDGLVRWLGSVTKLRVVVAGDGAAPRAGSVYFAPDGRELELSRDGILRTPEPSPEIEPGDRLLGSLARAYRDRAGGIIMTGMGDDGVAGLLAIRDAGGATFAQSRDTCVVFGMPGAAIARGATTELLAPAALADVIRELAFRGRGR